MTKDPAIRAGLGVALPFFARRMWVSLRRRPGAAPRVDFDPQALRRSPGVTWIGHATFLVRMDEATFLTDPMFSERASPLSFAGPPRLVPPGVPLDALPPVDFALVSHDHYDHADLPSLRALVARGTRASGHGRRRAAGEQAGGGRTWGSRACASTYLSTPPDAADRSSACGRAGWSKGRRAASTTQATPAGRELRRSARASDPATSRGTSAIGRRHGAARAPGPGGSGTGCSTLRASRARPTLGPSPSRTNRWRLARFLAGRPGRLHDRAWVLRVGETRAW